jgi:hypothetical protein
LFQVKRGVYPERARELDTLSEIKTLGVAAGYARKHDDDRYNSLIRRAMELNPSDSVPHYALTALLQTEGHTPEATLEFRTALQLGGDAPLVTLFDETLRKSDFPRTKRTVIETAIERLTTRAKTTYVSPRDFVERYLRINDNENALHWFGLAFAEHSSFLVQIAGDPLYDGLRTDPRFHAMLRRMRFPGAD